MRLASQRGLQDTERVGAYLVALDEMSCLLFHTRSYLVLGPLIERIVRDQRIF